ncbi:MAG: CRTAC1 family protein [Bryobacteraceae bacterium]
MSRHSGILACMAFGHLFLCSAASDEVFTDVTQRLGVGFRLENSPTTQKYLPETMCGGVAVFDYDNDGRLDIFFTNGAHIDDPMPNGKKPEKSNPRYSNRLYHQNPDGTFTDVTEKAGLAGSGYSMGVAVGDYDNDGFEDLFVTGLDRTTLYHNNGDGTFTDVTAKSGTATNGWSTSAGFFDYDNDGKLDLFVDRYVDWSFADNRRCGNGVARFYCHPLYYRGTTSVLYHNNGDGTFTDVSAKAGISHLLGRGLGVSFADYDHDGWTDIYVANDSMQSFLYHNNHDGTFTEEAIAAGVGYDEDGNAFAGMGVDFGDYNNDGLPDLVISDLAMQKYMLFQNSGGGIFTAQTESSGLARASMTSTGWGAKWADFDNDGWKDLFVAQGHTDDEIYGPSRILTYRQKPLLLRNEKGRLLPWPADPGVALAQARVGRGLAVGDLDNDGGIDVVVANIGASASILHNNIGARQHWIGLIPRGTKSNRDGIGCRVKVVGASGLTQFYTVNTAGSYLSASDRRLLIGLGADKSVKRIEARWPSGTVQVLENLKSNQWLPLVEPAK